MSLLNNILGARRLQNALTQADQADTIGGLGDFGRGVASGFLGAPADIASLFTAIQPPHHRASANIIQDSLQPFTSEGLLTRMGGRPDTVAGQVGLLGAPDPSDLGRVGTRLGIGMLAVPSPEFDDFIRPSRVLDESGEPQLLFHGSTGEFDRFNTELANVESDLGRGIYLSNNIDDVNANYAGTGPDLTNRIELMKERIIDEIDFDPQSDVALDLESFTGKSPASLTDEELGDAVNSFVRNQLQSTNQGQVTPLFAAVENPVKIGGDRPTWLSLEVEFDEAGDIIGESGDLVDFAEAIRNNAWQYEDFDADQFIGELFERADYDSITADDIYDLVSSSESIVYATDDAGRLVSKEIMREAYEDIGFDGILDRTVSEKFSSMEGMTPDTVHVVVFDPDKLNTAIGATDQ